MVEALVKLEFGGCWMPVVPPSDGETPDNPFDGEALRYQREGRATEQEARDFVVLNHLLLGDTRALAFWLQRSYVPGCAIRNLLSWMLQPERADVLDPDKTFSAPVEKIPFALVTADRRTGRTGRPFDPVAQERNAAIRDRYEELVQQYGRGGSDSAIKKLFEELGPYVGESTIREATKKRSKKKYGK